ncbi:MAG: leucine-rich repeat protein, partial [Oscillospiraceae bacterium]|nr:leucine-rich repeat protein [Oscillospiraceae bacterium]
MRKNMVGKKMFVSTRNRNKIVSLFLSAAMLLGIVTAVPMSAFADEVSAARFEYEGYTIDYSVAGAGNSPNVTVTITNTGTEIIRDWALVYDDFGGNITGVWGAVVSLTESGILHEELAAKYSDNPEVSEMLENFRKKFISELEYVESASNRGILPGESVSFGYTLSDATSTPGWIGFEADRVVAEVDVVAPVVEEAAAQRFVDVLATTANTLRTTNSDTPLLCTQMKWYFVLEGSGANQTATIVACFVNSDVIEIPETLRPSAGNMSNLMTLWNGKNLPVTKIADEALQNLTQINGVQIPGTFTHIGQRAFRNCLYLNSVTFDGQIPPTFGANVFQGISNALTVRTPAKAVSRYRSVPQLSSFWNNGDFVVCSACGKGRNCVCSYRLGDVNGNGAIDVFDALAIQSYSIGNTSIIVNGNDPWHAARIVTNGNPANADAEEI